MRLLALWMGVALSCGAAPRATAAPMPLSVLEPAWRDAFEFLLTRGAVEGVYRTTQPYPRDEVERALDAASRDASSAFDRALASRLREEMWTSGDRRLHWDGWGEVLWQPELSPRALPALTSAFQYQSGAGLTLYQEFHIAPEAAQMPELPGALPSPEHRVRGWNPKGILPESGYVADFGRALLSVRMGGLDVAVGRQSFAWGPGLNGGLLLSAASPGLDGVSLSGTFGRVRGTAVFAALNEGWHIEARRYLARRYFAAHRVHWKPSERLEVGMMDAVLYGGDVQPIRAYYLNPVLPFYASQFNAASDRNRDYGDDNVMIGFDARWTPQPGWSVYGELLVDDFPYDPDSPDPQALAWIAGLHRAGLRERGEWRVEYARAGRYTYTHLLEEQQYTHFGKSLGYPTGNDADVLQASAAWWVSPRSRVSLRIDQSRKGNSGIDDRYRGERDKSFLNGVAETRRSLTLGGWSHLSGGWFLGSDAAVIRVRSLDHVDGDDTTLFEWRGRIARRFGAAL